MTDNKGYTGHEMLDQLDLVHMNGRVYDPLVAKFISADPYVQDFYNGQNYNRYSYVLNNPTNLTDPTGYEWSEYMPVYGSVMDFKAAVGDGHFGMAGVHAILAITDGATLGVGTLVKDGVKVLIKAELKREAAQQLAKEGSEQAVHATAKATKAAEQATAKASEKAAGEGAAAESKGAATASERAKNPGKEKIHETYTKEHPETGEVYSGRTSGTGTPEQNVARRDTGHHKDAEGFGPAQLDKSSKDPAAIRGREQQLIDANGGAKSQGGTSGNTINGISPTNPKKEIYIEAAKKEFER